MFLHCYWDTDSADGAVDKSGTVNEKVDISDLGDKGLETKVVRLPISTAVEGRLGCGD